MWLQSHPVNAPRSAALAAPSAAPRPSAPALAAPLPDAIGRWAVISSHLERGGLSALMHGTASACLARFTIQAGSFSLLASFRSALHQLSPSTFPCTTCDALRPSSPQASPLVTTFASGFLTGAVLTPYADRHDARHVTVLFKVRTTHASMVLYPCLAIFSLFQNNMRTRPAQDSATSANFNFPPCGVLCLVSFRGRGRLVYCRRPARVARLSAFRVERGAHARRAASLSRHGADRRAHTAVLGRVL